MPKPAKTAKKALRSIGHLSNEKVHVSWDCCNDSQKAGPVPHVVEVLVRPPNATSNRPCDWVRFSSRFPDVDGALAFANMMWLKLGA